ncbi:hypothetical protein SASPL_127960 [Salvia splendens]|uniref:RRM domain-containing protein n=1 Tax=Salvia splendens TaxID=180675 RepID=A0A8X8ZMD3_SALSN|nr:hypothetical protein SASPL_127960 [Salvia splendens]
MKTVFALKVKGSSAEATSENMTAGGGRLRAVWKTTTASVSVGILRFASNFSDLVLLGQMRGRSYTPSPPRGYGRRERSPPRGGGGRYGRGGRDRDDAPTSLLVRNLRHDCRPEDLRRPFGQFGPVKDIYLPRDYYTGDPRGFGFVQFVDPADAADAKYHMDGQILQGRELTVVFAEENRKKPTEMRSRERGSMVAWTGYLLTYIIIYFLLSVVEEAVVFMIGGDHLLAIPVLHVIPPVHHLHGAVSTTLLREDIQGWMSTSPHEKRYGRERSYSRSPAAPRDQSPPPYDGARKHSGSPVRERSPFGSRSRSQSPGQGQGQGRGHSPVRAPPARSPSRSRSRSPYPADYPTGPVRDRSPSQ